MTEGDEAHAHLLEQVFPSLLGVIRDGIRTGREIRTRRVDKSRAAPA